MTRIFDLGPLRLDVDAALLSHAGTSLPLGPRAVAVLAMLVRHAPEMVAKADILDAAWRDAVVEESNLAVQISAIRRALKAVPGAAKWIETVPWRGYRFVGPVTSADAAPASSRVAHTNLRAATTSFIGREREQDEIARELRAARVLTIVGAGGSGKTRLAVELAARQAEAYPDGIWFIGLANVTDPARVADTVAQVLGIRRQGAQVLSEAIAGYLAARCALLVIDNCEHVRAASADLVATLIERAPRLKILATSREPLDLAQERTYRLDPLTLPAPGADAETVARSDAARLFVARARQQQPDFALTTASAPLVAQLCIDLDGMPLALEIAAARMQTLSVEQIAARLDDRFRLLTRTTATSTRHHQTLRTVLDWSYDLLAQDERSVLRRMAVFVDGATLAGIAAVVADPAIDAHAAVDVLARLDKRSLVVASGGSGLPRYHLHQTTRAYALERLAEAGETTDVQRRHAEHYRDLFSEIFDRWQGMSDAEWHAACTPELGNVRAALAWALDGGDAALGITLAAVAVRLFVNNLADRNEAREWIAHALARADHTTSARDRARLALAQAMLAEVSSLTVVIDAFAEAIAAQRAAGDREGLAYALVSGAYPLVYANRLAEADAALAEAARLLEGSTQTRSRIAYLGAVAYMMSVRDDAEGALATSEQAIALCRSTGVTRVAALLQSNVAEMAWLAGDLDRALVANHEVMTTLRGMPDMAGGTAMALCLINRIGMLVERGDLAAALRVAHDAHPPCRDNGLAPQLLDHLALRAARTGRLADAARIGGCSDAAHAAREILRQRGELRVHARLAAELAQAMAPAEIARLRAEGEAMDLEAAFALALGD